MYKNCKRKNKMTSDMHMIYIHEVQSVRGSLKTKAQNKTNLCPKEFFKWMENQIYKLNFQKDQVSKQSDKSYCNSDLG